VFIKSNKKLFWWLWLVTSCLLGGYYAYALVGPDKSLYLPGATTAGHYQIEAACTACHKQSFEGINALQKSCMQCHGDELKAVDDSHPKSKFTDPRNADRVAILDARYCVTCHREHRPGITRPMGVTLPDDFCSYCHKDIAEDRPSHKGMAFNTCASAGCHNFHDNKALYEDFLVKHIGEPETFPEPYVAKRNLSEFVRTISKTEIQSLRAAQADAPANVVVDSKIRAQWASTGHARSGVNCTDCHNVPVKNSSVPTSSGNPVTEAKKWLSKPGISACKSCHELEMKGFLQGKHGMRLEQNLDPMQPAMARQPMKRKNRDKSIDCNTCHAEHGYDTHYAAVQACLSCHEDKHSKQYKASPHFRLWESELSGKEHAGSGVSCATCHLPRRKQKDHGVERVVVQHNQNHNLRPNEKMIREVCMNCHGLAFAIDALADPVLVQNNFKGRPSRHIESIDMAAKRVKEKKKKKQRKAFGGQDEQQNPSST
jgi:formate-dependent nitrite reductase cytochrome c552 subunit